MKKILIPLATILFFAGCKPEKFKTLEAPVANIAALSASWKLTSVVQKDEGAEIKNSPFVTMDITSLFPYSESRLMLNSSSDGQPSTYAYTKGNAPAIITSPTGNWKVDNVASPKNIWFINGTDTTKMELGSLPRSFDNSFSLKIVKIDQDTKKLALSYTYRFDKN